ncbi:hypothetical protein DL96DRAFT_1558122 [Flagelloscypha sp. PMI_526]|nr:hypothetical protein DL96DRAFT_1558122 [Flagelloscypha sp. PMI_526]
MGSACPASFIAPRLPFELRRILDATKDIEKPDMLFYRSWITAEGNSMGELDIALKDKITDVYDDISSLFPVLHEQQPHAPNASQAFNAIVMGVILNATKKEGGLDTLALLFTTIHQSTTRLRTLPTGSQLPNSDRLNLFLEILELVSDTIPTTMCPLGFGKTLNPAEFMQKDRIRHKLDHIHNLVGILAGSSV